MRELTAFFLLCLAASPTLSSEPVPFSINTKKWSHVLDEHFISITVNPTDLLQGKVFGLTMNSTMAILKGLAPAYVRIGSADTSKYTFKKSRYPNDMVKPEDEYTVSETHWMVFNEVLQSAGLDVIICLNAAHRIEGTKKWDTRNSLELISFSDSQGYNLTWQLGYEVHSGDDLSGIQFGKDLNRLRTILNAFPRYQHSKLIGPDIRVIHKKEDVDFWNDVLIEAGPTLDALTWHPRWPQPSKMKVSENSELGYEFPADHLEWDKMQLNKILQKSIFKNGVWIGETKRESTGTFAEGLIWARRLVLSAKLGIEVVMKQPNLMDITHPKPEYWIALLHKRLLGKAVLETKSVTNMTDLTVISHCTNPYFWTDKPEKLQDGPITVYAVNMGGMEQKIQIRGPTWTGRPQLLFQYVLTSGSDPDSVFSQMTYLNGEPLMMSDEGTLPDIIPKVKKLEKGLTMKLPPYSVGFWVVPEAKVKICQVSPQNLPTLNIETLTPSAAHKSATNNLKNIEDINQFIVEKLKNPESESEEMPDIKIELASSESSEKEINLMPRENSLPRIARRIREIREMKPEIDDVGHLKALVHETQHLLIQPHEVRNLNERLKLPKPTPAIEHRIYSIAEGISDAMKTSNQQHEFDKFLEHSGLKQDFGKLLVSDRQVNAPRMTPEETMENPPESTRLRRSIDGTTEEMEADGEREESVEEVEDKMVKPSKFDKKIALVDEKDDDDEDNNRKQDVFIPHQPDLKGLEDRYKAILQIKLEDGKRKIDDLKKKIEEGAEMTSKIKPEEEESEIQEEIIKKEIELISKTEETVADIFNSQKKRQENLEDLLFDELNDVKGERLNALVEIQKNLKKKENSIRKRQAPSPLVKTVEYIEKNFNLEPESVHKIKRSLEEKMGDIFKNYDTRKSAEVKRRFAPQKEERRLLKRPISDDQNMEGKRERKLEMSNLRMAERERIKDRGLMKKQPLGSSRVQTALMKESRKHYPADVDDREEMYTDRRGEPMHRSRKNEELIYRSRKMEEPSIRSRKGEREEYKIRKSEEPTYKTRKIEESHTKLRKSAEPKMKMEDLDNDSFELFNAKKFEIPPTKKSERRLQLREKEEKPMRMIKKMPVESSKMIKTSPRNMVEEEPRKTVKPLKQESEEMEFTEESEEVVEEDPPQPEIPLKHDKDRRANMLKQITSMVENMNSMEKDRGRLKRMNYDEDLSTEFEPDRRTMGIKRRPREADDAHMAAAGDLMMNMSQMKESHKTYGMMEPYEATESSASAPVSKLDKYRKLRKRPSRRMKALMKDEGEELGRKRHLLGFERPLFDSEKKKLLKPRLRKINPKFIRLGNDYPQEKTVNLLKDDEQKITTDTSMPLMAEPEQMLEMMPSPVPEIIPIQEQPKELLKDLEEIIQEQHFLGQDSEIIKDESKISGSKYSGTWENSGTIMTDPKPTEGYIIVDPTPETELNQEKNKEFKMTMKDQEGKAPEAIKMANEMMSTTKPTMYSHENVAVVDPTKVVHQVKTIRDIKLADQVTEGPNEMQRAEKIVVIPELNQMSQKMVEAIKGHKMVDPMVEAVRSDGKMKKELEEASKQTKTVNAMTEGMDEKAAAADNMPAVMNQNPEFAAMPEMTNPTSDILMMPETMNPTSDILMMPEIINSNSDTTMMPEMANPTSDILMMPETMNSNSEIMMTPKMKDSISDTQMTPEMVPTSDFKMVPMKEKIKKLKIKDTSSGSISKDDKTQLLDIETSAEYNSDEDKMVKSEWNAEEASDESNEPCNRKRRATFLSSRREQPDNEDYSSEERIKRFKQMVYRRGGASSKKPPAKNEIRSVGSGLNADDFLKMAGSTVRVVFDDVIPEAYGQTKTKIQNMGLSEYIKEFGNLVQQMRNLDQIFLNIGEAAIKGYIRGNRAEKGPYIQVISRKKREAAELEDMKEKEPTSMTEHPNEDLTEIKSKNTENMKNQIDSTNLKPFRSEGNFRGQETPKPDEREKSTVGFSRSESNHVVSSDRGSVVQVVQAIDKIGKRLGVGAPEGLAQEAQGSWNQEEIKTAASLLTPSQTPKNILPIYPELPEVETVEVEEAIIDPSSKQMDTKDSAEPNPGLKMKMLSINDIKAIARDTALGDWINTYIKDDLRQNISPWIKTTKDFIQQALTTLQRQRQLSEILARDGVNLLKAEARKNIEKRDVTDEDASLPVFHMINPATNKKREAQKQSDESLIRHLRGLQPGVYVVPTDEMTNVRSEQIMNEAKQKSGMPNVVTLNIYYDKKNQDGSVKVEEAASVSEPRISQDTVTYYQNKGWNSVAGHYDQNNQFVSPIQELSMNPSVVTPVQVGPMYTPDSRVPEVPNARIFQYPPPLYHYPATPKIVSTVVPNPHPVYGPVMYVQPETSYISQPPGTKRHWREYKFPRSGLGNTNMNSGWTLQYGSLPSASKKVPKSKLIPSTFRVIGDKKRSIGKINPTWSESALPFWKFFTESSGENMDDQSREVKEKGSVAATETTSVEDLFSENRKRANKAAKKAKVNSVEVETKEPEEKESQSRQKRSLDSEDEPNRKLVKRNYPFHIDFEDHDILPQWFGTYQELDNTLDDLPPHIRRSHIVSTPWSNEEDELLTTIFDADDELTILDVDDGDDYYITGDNALTQLVRHPRSTDSGDSVMLKTNMIFKSMDDDLIQQKMNGMKKLKERDSSKEVISKPTANENKMTSEIKQQIQQQIEEEIRKSIQEQFLQKKPEVQQQQSQQKVEPQTSAPLTQSLSLQQLLQPQQLQPFTEGNPEPFPRNSSQNGSEGLPKSSTDDSLYYFFKYAYDSFVKVMKSMTQFF